MVIPINRLKKPEAYITRFMPFWNHQAYPSYFIQHVGLKYAIWGFVWIEKFLNSSEIMCIEKDEVSKKFFVSQWK